MKANKQDSADKMMKLIEYFKATIASYITSIKNQINNFKSSPTEKDSPKPPDPTTVVLDNRSYPPLDDGKSTKIGDMWTQKHDISSPKFYELLIKA